GGWGGVDIETSLCRRVRRLGAGVREQHTAGSGRRGPAGTQARSGSIVASVTGARRPRTREAPLEVEDVYLVRADGDTSPAVKRLAERGQELLSTGISEIAASHGQIFGEGLRRHLHR